jgi:putative nucleotidyltransferase with HDIG domain
MKLFEEILQNKKIKNLLEELRNYHLETYEHCLRVGELCMKIGEKNNFSEDKIKLLGICGLFHDLGKLDVSKEILDKNSELDNEERKEIEKHSKNGFERMKNFPEVREIILHHHSHQKNNYPCGLKEKEVFCKLAQIVAVCDMFDALTNKRVYKEKFSNEKAKKILEKEFTGEKIYIEQIFNIN